MGEHTGIVWTDATWNPTIGCTPISEGCDHCYARRIVNRFQGAGAFDTIERSEDRLHKPLSWRNPRRIFVGSLSDIFHDQVPSPFLDRILSVVARAPRHTFQILTKRHARLRSHLGDPALPGRIESIVGQPLSWPLPNLWVGVTAETQAWANIRVPALLAVPATVRFVSAEPLLGPLDLSSWLRPAPCCGHVDPDGLCGHPDAGTPECHQDSDCPVCPTYQGLDWVICGGESGPGARPMFPDWPRDLRDQCERASIPFLFKQHGEWLDLGEANRRGLRPGGQIRSYPGAIVKRVGTRAAGRLLDDQVWNQYPLEVLV